MQLKEIYRPIQKELADIERTIRLSIRNSANASVLKISNYLLDSGGKRLRPALVILSARAASNNGLKAVSKQLIHIASAVELVHLATLIHDDVIDHSQLRHNKPTVNAKWGEDVSITLGDYFYSVGFDLISSCRNMDILNCFSEATRLMCEGELVQVCERDHFNLLKERYITIIKNKTANLFGASCQAGVLAVGREADVQTMLKNYGLNFGIAFQIVDDFLDLMGSEKDLGKAPGTDFKMGELTLPILHLFSLARDKKRILRLMAGQHNEEAFFEVRRKFINSDALDKTKQDIFFYIQRAKRSLDSLAESEFKRSLMALADFVSKKINLREENSLCQKF